MLFTDSNFDLHIYTNNTKGGNDKVSFLCETAVEKGLRAIAFTDRCDIDLFDKYDIKRRLRHSYFDMIKAKGVFFDSLMVLCGIEFAQAVANPPLVSEVLKKEEYDIVLTSVTRNPDGSDFGINYETPQKEFDDFALRYSNLLIQTLEQTDTDVLSKPLSVLTNVGANFSSFGEYMQPVLKLLAEKKKALEINAKDLCGSDRVRDLYTKLLKDFKNYGGQYITIGSEANYNEEIGKNRDLCLTAAKIAGFSAITLYDKRIPYLFET